MNTARNVLSSLRLLVAGVLLGAATLTQAQINQTLYATPASPTYRDNYAGGVGCKFTVGSSNVIVSHLGYFSTNTVTGLNSNHFVGVYSTASGLPLLGQVIVPAGTGAYYTNSFYWVQLNPPLLLTSNTAYYAAALPYSGDGDYWGDSGSVTFNPWFVGTQVASTQNTAYGPGGSTTWPIPSLSTFGSGTTYCIEGMAYIEAGPALAGVQVTNATLSAGQTLKVNGFASGQGPVTNQWWMVASPNNLLISTTTNHYATLVISNATTSASGTYYLTASNALGGSQSSNVTVLITSFPVSITLQPTNVTAYANYPASFTTLATGSPPVTYQWYRDGVLITGATNTNYTLAYTSMTNNGDIYTCVASNFTSGTPYTQTTSNAALTVAYNLAWPQRFLHGFNNKLVNNTYGGQQGGQFVTGNYPVLVTHLGFYAWPANTTTNGGNITCVLTNTGHYVGLYNANGTTLLGSVLVPQGSNPVTNGYMWEPLDPPLMLSTNTQYLLDAQTTTSGDPWGDSYAVPDLNPYIATSCDAIYGGAGWGSAPYLGGAYAGQMYSAPNLATLALPTPSAYAFPAEGVTLYAGFSTNLTAIVEGQAPVTAQWYEEPNVLLPNQTNLTLSLSNITVSESGSYYVIATNPITGAYGQSPDVVVTVNPDSYPYIVQDIAPSAPVIVVGSSVAFSAIFNGSPTYTYGWQLNGNAVTNSSRISGANGNVLVINNVQANDAGTYQLFATNAEGYGQSSPATLTVVPAMPFDGGIGWSSQGDTVSWANTNILQITSGYTGESNSAFCSSPLYVGAFEATFSYQLVNPYGTSADGVTFCIQNDSRGAAALGADGGALGVSGVGSTPGPASSLAIYPSVEFEMDIYTDGRIGVVAFATNGTIGTYGPTTNGTTPPLVLTNGDVISNFVSYNGTTMTVTMTDVSVGSTNYGATFVTNQTINIPSVLGTNVAYVGFTGGDGASVSTQQISDFSFVSLLPLSAQTSSGNLLLSWPDAAGSYMLMHSPVLGPSANWTPVSVTPTFANGTNQAAIPISGTTSFYQLVLTNVPNF